MKFIPIPALACLCGTLAYAQGTFTPLGVLPGGVSSQANDISSDGQVVVGYSSEGGLSRTAFIWSSQSGMVSLGELPGGDESSFAACVSDDGTVVAGFSSTDIGSVPFRWTSETGMVGIGDPFDAGLGGSAQGISGDGKTIVGLGWRTVNEAEAFAWTSDNGFLGLGDLPGGTFGSRALAASADGSVIAGAGGTLDGYVTGDTAMRWTAQEGMISLGWLAEGERSFASGMNDDGSIIFGSAYLDGRQRAVRWINGDGPFDLGEFPGGEYRMGAHDMTEDGALIVGSASLDGKDATRRAWLWDEQHGFRDFTELLASRGLLPDGWVVHRAYGCSDDGRHFAGYGTNPQGAIEAYTVTVDLSCYADFTDDGALDLFDFLAYVNLFNAGGQGAECDGDAGLTLFDFLCFVNRFNEGC